MSTAQAPDDADDATTPLDRCADERREPGLLDRLVGDPATRVVEWRDGTALVVEEPDGLRLVLRSPRAEDLDGTLCFLGRDPAGVATLAVAGTAADGTAPDADAGAPPAAGLDHSGRWAGLRDVGAHLGPRDVDRFMAAQALLYWHARNPHCPRCGALTRATHAGWTRSCPVDGSEHYPRTDPAVIMAVVDDRDRILLARSPAWPEGRRSVLAGFVEPGERLESAVAREVHEEVGLVVDEVRYADSQPWPFPASLMLGFTAHARDAQLRLDDAEIVEAEWYTRDELADRVADGSLGLPGRLSIARRLIEGWFGERLTPPQEVAFHRAG